MDSIKLFEDKNIRTLWDEVAEKWYFSVIDVVGILAGSENPRKYWSVLKTRLNAEGNQTATDCSQLKMMSADGKMRETDVADTEQILRLIQSIPSPKAEPFKLWLAKVGNERIDEMADPECERVESNKRCKMNSLSEIENKLLAGSTADDLCKPITLTAEQVRKEVSIIARTLINGYGGWGVEGGQHFLDQDIKSKVLKGLVHISNHARDMAPRELYRRVGAVLRHIPDGHISLNMQGENTIDCKLKRNRKQRRKIGSNLATEKEVVKIQRCNDAPDVALLAISTFSKWWEKFSSNDAEWDQFCEGLLKQFTEVLDGSSALIIDLRGNRGGDMMGTDKLLYYLYGAQTRNCIKNYTRTTDEAKRLLGKKQYERDWKDIDTSKDPAVIEPEKEQPAFEADQPGYKKPIYILVDNNVCSAAENFISRLKPHPYMKLVGDNTSGCRVYGQVRPTFLPHSGIELRVGLEYRVMEYGFEELKGFTPDIRCEDGQNAFEVAMKEIEKNKSKTAAIKNGISLCKRKIATRRKPRMATHCGKKNK